MWDEYKQENFDLPALLFITINDCLALSNLSGQSNKGYQDCTHCLDETVSFYLNFFRKVMYMEKFAKMGPQILVFAVLPLAPHFIGTDGPTVSFTGSGKFTSGQCLQS